MYKIKRFFNRFYNLYRWLPIIWKDQDWDDFYIFEVLKFKLKNQAKYIAYHDRHVSAKRDAEIMMTCVRLIDKVQEEFYRTEYLDYYNAKLTFVLSDKYPDSYELGEEFISEDLDDYFKIYPRLYKQVRAEDPTKERYLIASRMSYINEDRAHKLLFKILENNIRNWWD